MTPLAPLQPIALAPQAPPLPGELGLGSPEDLKKLLLALAPPQADSGMSPAASQIINHMPASPEELAALPPTPPTPPSPQDEAVGAIRKALAGGGLGLDMPSYGALSPAAQGTVNHWVGGGQDFSAAPDAATLGRLASQPNRVNSSRVSSAIAGISGAGGIPEGVRPEDLMGDKAKWYASQAAASVLQPQDTAGADALMQQRGHYQVAPGELPNEAPGWHASPLDQQGKAKEAAAIAADDKFRHQSDAMEAIRAAMAQPQITKNAQEERTMRKLRMNGPEWLLAQQNGGAYNPAAAAMFPQLGEAQLAGQHATNDTTRADAAMTEANAHANEFGFLQTPMGLAQSLARAGQPVPPEIAQAAAAQALRGTNQGSPQAGGAYPPSVVLSSLPQGTPPDQILETVLSHNPQPHEIPEYAKSLANRGVTPAVLLKMRDALTTRPGSFADSASKLFGEDPTNKTIEDQKRKLIDQLIGQMGGTIPRTPTSKQVIINPFDAGYGLGQAMVGGPPPIPEPKRIVPKR